MKYENGVAEAISQPVSSTCYRTDCTITLTAKGGKLTAHASTTPLPAPVTDPNLKLSVDLEADIASNTLGAPVSSIRAAVVKVQRCCTI